MCDPTPNEALTTSVRIAAKRGDRRALRAEELTDQEIELVAQAESPIEHTYLDAEIENWEP